MHRPASVTIIGAFLAAGGFLLLLICFFVSSGDLPKWMGHAQVERHYFSLTVSAVEAIITFVCGVFMLKGENWARWLYAIMWGCGLILALIYSEHEISYTLVSSSIRLFFIICLFQPGANDYFRSHRRRLRR